MNPFLATLRERHLQGEIGGMTAVCSAHPDVLRVAMRTALETGHALLVEATVNQVNPHGGYTGMTPAAFARQVGEMGRAAGAAADRIILGADHLGPYAWQGQPAAQAMKNVETLARLCVEAGFRKIHLDTGVACADDPGPPLPLETAALRAARLCRAAEAAVVRPDHPPMYVIGNDVPPPGGGLTPDAQVHVTSPDQLDATLQAYRRAFERAGVRHAWERVMAVVVQPGVEFGDQRVAVYDPEQAVCLSAAHACLPGAMTFEIHAADYQPPEAMDRMVADHFVLLKVGPCLTFAFRRALYGLESIERQLPGIAHRSNLTQVMEDLMTADPQHWQGRYAGDEAAARYLRHHSLRDRIRYYWSRPAARQAVDRLMDNLKQSLPDELIERHLPEHHADIQRLGLNADPGAIVHLYISEALAPYVAACGRSLL